jgi:alpha-D-ribose 1-methylphosphonate 5-triphosphate synthase subunit PhnH
MTSVMEKGFADLARDSQRVFRAAMNAMARPGSIVDVDAGLAPPEPLTAGAAALALALCDYETPLWRDAAMSNDATRDYLRFHTGAPIVAASEKAAFALVASSLGLPDLNGFSLGSLEYPDASTTLIVQVRSFTSGEGWRLRGPGIDGETLFEAAPLPGDFIARRAALLQLFPRGLDFLFVADGRAAALPRTTLIEA